MSSSSKSYTVRSNVHLYPGMGGWHFASIPKTTAAEIKAQYGAERRGWGSIKVLATIGATTWSTSLFPDTPSGTYLLPLKAAVRKKEHVLNGDSITLTVQCG